MVMIVMFQKYYLFFISKQIQQVNDNDFENCIYNDTDYDTQYNPLVDKFKKFIIKVIFYNLYYINFFYLYK